MNHPLLNRDVLLGLGVCLVMLGLVLRGFARNFRRDPPVGRNTNAISEIPTTAASATPWHNRPPGWNETWA